MEMSENHTPCLWAVILSLSLSFTLSSCVLLVPFVETDLPKNELACRCRANNERSAAATEEHQNKNFPYTVPKPVLLLSSGRVQAAVQGTRQLVVRRAKPAPTLQTRISALLGQLQDQNAALRTNAATDLGMIGPAASSAISPLIRAVKNDDSKWVRRAAVKALVKISSGPDVVKTLQFALGDSNVWVAHSAAGALRRIGNEQEAEVLKKQPIPGPKQVAAVFPAD
jgi:hypothetical protein